MKNPVQGMWPKKIERISLEGELSWVAGHKNRKAPNRCSYLTFTHRSLLQLNLIIFCRLSLSKDLCGAGGSSSTNHTNSFRPKTLSW